MPPNQGVIPNEGKIDLLSYQLRPWGTEPNPWSLCLYVNDYTPDADSVLADFLEPVYAEYFAWTLYRDQWKVPVIVNDVAVSTWGTNPVVFGGPVTPTTIYGAFYRDNDLGVVRFAYRFDNPWAISTGTPLRFIPQFTYGTFIPC